MQITMDVANLLMEMEKIAKECGKKYIDTSVMLKKLIEKQGFIVEYFKDKGITEENLNNAVDKVLKSYEEDISNLPELYKDDLLSMGVDYTKANYFKIKSVIPANYDSYDDSEDELEENDSQEELEESNVEEKDENAFYIDAEISYNVYFIFMEYDRLADSLENCQKIYRALIELIILLKPKLCVALEKVAQVLNIELVKPIEWYNKLRINDKNKVVDIIYRSTGSRYLTPVFKQVNNQMDGMDELIDLTNKEENREFSRICDVDKEMDKLYSILSYPRRNNIVIVGEEGVGKSALVEKLAYDVVHHNKKAEKLGFKKVYRLKDTISCTSLTPDVLGKLSKQAENFYLKLGMQDDYILSLEIFDVFSAGEIQSLLYVLKRLISITLEQKNVRLIILLGKEAMNSLLFEDTTLLPERFTTMKIAPTKAIDVCSKLRNQVKYIKQNEDIKFSDYMLKFVVNVASCCFEDKVKEPGRTLNSIKEAISIAKRNNRSRVTKKDIYQVFNLDFDRFKKMNEESKRSTAYHECGHFLVLVNSDLMKTNDPISVSIVPRNYYLGVTTLENNGQYPSGNMEWIIDQVALDLGGRIGEKMYTGKESIGASSDLASATNLIYYALVDVGMGKNYAPNLAVPLSTMSERMKDDLYKEAQEIVQNAYKRAEKIIKDNKEALDEISELLVKKGIISAQEGLKIINKYKK